MVIVRRHIRTLLGICRCYDRDDDDDDDEQRRDGGAEVDPVPLFEEPLRSPLVQHQSLVFIVQHLGHF